MYWNSISNWLWKITVVSIFLLNVRVFMCFLQVNNMLHDANILIEYTTSTTFSGPLLFHWEEKTTINRPGTVSCLHYELHRFAMLYIHMAWCTYIEYGSRGGAPAALYHIFPYTQSKKWITHVLLLVARVCVYLMRCYTCFPLNMKALLTAVLFVGRSRWRGKTLKKTMKCFGNVVVGIVHTLL